MGLDYKRKNLRIRPRSRTLTHVQDAMLDDIVAPSEVVGRRCVCAASPLFRYWISLFNGLFTNLPVFIPISWCVLRCIYRWRVRADGSKLMKVHLDPKDKAKDNLEEKLWTFAAVYKRLTNKDAAFMFPDHVY